MMSSLLSERVYVDDGQLIIQQKHDFQPVFDANRRRRLENPKGTNKDKSMKEVAEIPLALIPVLEKHFGIPEGTLLSPEGEKYRRIIFKSKEFEAFRTSEGAV